MLERRISIIQFKYKAYESVYKKTKTGSKETIEIKDDIEINEFYVAVRLEMTERMQSRRSYIESFEAMARKGFMSFDRDTRYDNDSVEYVWIARPKRSVNVDIKGIPQYPEGMCGEFNHIKERLHVDCLD